MYNFYFYKNICLLFVFLLTMFELNTSPTNSSSHFVITSPFAIGKYIPIVNNTIRIEYSIYKYKKYNYDWSINSLFIVTKHHFKKNLYLSSNRILQVLPFPSEKGCISSRNLLQKHQAVICLSLNLSTSTYNSGSILLKSMYCLLWNAGFTLICLRCILSLNLL